MASSTAVIILQYGGADLTIQCIDSLLKVNSAPIKLIVVDNASPQPDAADLVVSHLKELFPDSCLDTDASFSLNKGEKLPMATLIRSESNSGYARGNNIGVRLAFDDPDIDALLISNPDIIYTHNVIPRLKVSACLKHDGALFGPILYRPGEDHPHDTTARNAITAHDLTRTNFRLLHTPDDVIERSNITITPGTGLMPAELISGGCFFVLKDIFEQIGAFDPETWLYYEENILWERIKAQGLRNYIDTSTHAFHLIGELTKQRPRLSIVKAGLVSQRHLVRSYLRPGLLDRIAYEISTKWCYSVLYLRNLLRKK